MTDHCGAWITYEAKEVHNKFCSIGNIKLYVCLSNLASTCIY